MQARAQDHEARLSLNFLIVFNVKISMDAKNSTLLLRFVLVLYDKSSINLEIMPQDKTKSDLSLRQLCDSGANSEVPFTNIPLGRRSD